MRIRRARSLPAVVLAALWCITASDVSGADFSGADVSDTGVPETGVTDTATAADALDDWVEGPVRWLLLPEDWKAFRQARKQDRVAEFVEAFWSRRDPRPLEAGNSFRELFERRQAAADALYTEGGVMGALTDRGRAFILLGSPTHVRVSSEPSLDWTAEAGVPRRTATRSISIETWGFRLEDLPDGLLEIAGERKRGAGDTLSLTLTFRSNQDHAELIEGEALLDLAARSHAHPPQN